VQGVISTGITYYLQGVIMKDRGPVFVTAFRPLTMILVAIMASFMLNENMYLGMCAFNLASILSTTSTPTDNLIFLTI
jgi:hypothetical protein